MRLILNTWMEWLSYLFSFHFFLLFSDDCIVIDCILLLFIMMVVPSSVNCHDMMCASHLSISSLPPDVNRRCSNVWIALCNFFNALVRLLLFQSFSYCLLSSTKPSICLIHWFFLSGELIWQPSYLFRLLSSSWRY